MARVARLAVGALPGTSPARCGIPLAEMVGVGPARGALVVEGGAAGRAIMERFVGLAGGAGARIVTIPTGASLVRSRSGVVVDPDWPRDRQEWRHYEAELRAAWRELGVTELTILHTRDRAEADGEAFVAPLRRASGVWLGPGNAGRYAAAYLDTLTHRELAAVLDRGGVIGGTSAGAIILGSYTVRGRPDKPLLMARGHERGFGFLRHVALNPHLRSARRESELVNVIDAFPTLLGLGIDENTALVVQGDSCEVIGEGLVAVYDDRPHDGRWYFWLRPGERFDLRTRTLA
jgi:cyanophycinase